MTITSKKRIAISTRFWSVLLAILLFLVAPFHFELAQAQSLLSNQMDIQGTLSERNLHPSISTFNAEIEPISPETDEMVNNKNIDEQPKYLDLDKLNGISSLIEEGEYNQALAVLEKNSKDDSVLVDEGGDFALKEYQLFLIIKAHFHLGHVEMVESLSNKYLEQYVNGEHFYWVYYYLSSTLFSQNKPLQQVYLVTEDFFINLPKQERYNLRKYLIENALRSKEFLSAINFLEDEDGNLIQGYEQWIDEIIKNISDIEDVDQILDRYENVSIYYQLQLRKVQLMIRNGSIAEAEELYHKLVLTSADEIDQYEKLSPIFETIRLAKEIKPYRIGVILPISHNTFKLLARQVLDGLELALQKFKIEGRPIELVIKDSSQKDSLPEMMKLSPQAREVEKQKLVKNHLKDLVENYGVIAILGPLLKSTSLAAGEAAEKYRIPVISFSLTENVGEESPFLFRFQQSQFQEAKILADYAVDYLNAKRFVLFYNSSSKSFDVMQTFADEVKSKGAVIVGISRINPRQEDFSDSFRSFTGGLRAMTEEELEELKKTRERPDSVVDFDAVFLPVGTRTLKVVMDFARLYDADKSWFLSGSEINVRENQLLDNTKRLRFVDTFPVSGVKTYLQPFFESHWKQFNFRNNYNPPTNYTIYGYEALEIITRVLQESQNQNREALKIAIQNLKSFEVLTGDVSANKNGELDKRLKILKMVGSDTVEVF